MFLKNISLVVLALLFIGCRSFSFSEIKAASAALPKEDVPLFCALLANAASTAVELRGVRSPEEMHEFYNSLAELGNFEVSQAFRQALRYGYEGKMTSDEAFVAVRDACLS